MKYPLPIKVLFGFVIFLTILTLILKISFGSSLFDILSWLLPSGVVLYSGFLIVRRGQKKEDITIEGAKMIMGGLISEPGTEIV